MVDSGCGRPCCPEGLAKGGKIQSTPQSRRGHVFVGPAGERYRNKGKITVSGKNAFGLKTALEFNVAEGVDQALASVAAVNDVDNLAVFDSSGERRGSIILNGDTPAGRAIREAVQQALRREIGSPIERIKHTYVTTLWLDDDDEAEDADATAGFPRQGS